MRFVSSVIPVLRAGLCAVTRGNVLPLCCHLRGQKQHMRPFTCISLTLTSRDSFVPLFPCPCSCQSTRGLDVTLLCATHCDCRSYSSLGYGFLSTRWPSRRHGQARDLLCRFNLKIISYKKKQLPLAPSIGCSKGKRASDVLPFARTEAIHAPLDVHVSDPDIRRLCCRRRQHVTLVAYMLCQAASPDNLLSSYLLTNGHFKNVFSTAQ
jgi:hypothetical protein